MECHVIVPGRGHVGLKEGGGYKGGRRREGRCIFWKENKQNLVMDWRWGINEEKVPKMTPRFLS